MLLKLRCQTLFNSPLSSSRLLQGRSQHATGAQVPDTIWKLVASLDIPACYWIVKIF